MGWHSEEQLQARERNWQILRLRGAYDLMRLSPYAELMRGLVDKELKRLGAEPETDRRARHRKEYEEAQNKRSGGGHPNNVA